MSRIVGVLLIVFLILVGIGVLIPFIYKARATSDRVQCQDHLRRFGFAIFHASLPGQMRLDELAKEYPAGTLKQPFPPEERISWLILLLNSIDHRPDVAPIAIAPKNKSRTKVVDPYQAVLEHWNPAERWNSESNLIAARTRVKPYLCPAAVPEIPEGAPAVTQYVGLAGIGQEIASLSREQAGRLAGVYRYGESTPLGAFTDGLSNTIAHAETNLDIGPWFAGGPTTVRGLDPKESRYFGPGRAFGGFHVNGTNMGMADGSVRFINPRVHVGIFRAMLTIRGGETEFD